MKTVYAVVIQGVIPVTVTMNVLADSEFEAESLAARVAECQIAGVKSNVFELEIYPADYLRFDAVSEITPIAPDQLGGKRWDREKIEELLGETTLHPA